MIFVKIKTMSSRCGPWRGGFPGVENASADCRLLLSRKFKSMSKSIQLVWLCHTKLFSKEIFGHFLLFGKQLLPNALQPSEILNENKHFSWKKSKDRRRESHWLEKSRWLWSDNSPNHPHRFLSSNDDKRDYEKHIDAMAVERIHQSNPPLHVSHISTLSSPTSLRHSSKCSSVHWTAVSNQSTLHFIFSLFLLCDSMRFAYLQMKSFDLAKSFCPSSSRSGCMTSSANGSN